MSCRYCGFGSRPLQPSECRKIQRVVIFLLVESCLQVVKHAISVKRNRAKRIKRRMPALCKALASHAYLTGYRGQLLFHFTEGKREKWRHKGTCPQLQRVVEPLETFGPPDPEYGPSLILYMNDTPKSWEICEQSLVGICEQAWRQGKARRVYSQLSEIVLVWLRSIARSVSPETTLGWVTGRAAYQTGWQRQPYVLLLLRELNLLDAI